MVLSNGGVAAQLVLPEVVVMVIEGFALIAHVFSRLMEEHNLLGVLLLLVMFILRSSLRSLLSVVRSVCVDGGELAALIECNAILQDLLRISGFSCSCSCFSFDSLLHSNNFRL